MSTSTTDLTPTSLDTTALARKKVIGDLCDTASAHGWGCSVVGETGKATLLLSRESGLRARIGCELSKDEARITATVFGQYGSSTPAWTVRYSRLGDSLEMVCLLIGSFLDGGTQAA